MKILTKMKKDDKEEEKALDFCINQNKEFKQRLLTQDYDAGGCARFDRFI